MLLYNTLNKRFVTVDVNVTDTIDDDNNIFSADDN